MGRGSEAGSYLRLIDFVYHSTLGLRVIKKKKEGCVRGAPVKATKNKKPGQRRAPSQGRRLWVGNSVGNSDVVGISDRHAAWDPHSGLRPQGGGPAISLEKLPEIVSRNVKSTRRQLLKASVKKGDVPPPCEAHHSLLLHYSQT